MANLDDFVVSEVASNLRPPRSAVLSATDPSPVLRDRVKSSQDFTFGHPSYWERGWGRGRQVNKFDRSLNLFATK
jgi:hypothetical protein